MAFTRAGLPRRRFLGLSAAGTLAALGDLGFLGHLPPVARAEARVDPARVGLHPEIEPLVRLLEETPRERAARGGGGPGSAAGSPTATCSPRCCWPACGTSSRGRRRVQVPRRAGRELGAPREPGFARRRIAGCRSSGRSITSRARRPPTCAPATGRSARSTRPPSRPPTRRGAAFVAAMDRWDEPAADAAIAGLARTARPGEIFELFARYGARDFRDIGHKAIYVANSFRTLDVIGWQHAEPVLRSLAYALLDKDGDPGNPSTSDLPADRPYRRNQQSAARLRAGWSDGRASADGGREMLHALRQATPEAASALAIDLVNRGVAPQSIFEACFESSAELLMRSPGILSLHATTFTNAVGYAWQRCHDEGTRRLLLLQNASFLPLFRGAPGGGVAIDTLEPLPPRSTGPAAIEEIFAEVSRDRPVAARKVLGFLEGGGDVRPLGDAIRRLIFLKGTDSHDYKYSSAVLDDAPALAASCRARMLAAGAFYFKGSASPDTSLAQRVRSALAG